MRFSLSSFERLLKKMALPFIGFSKDFLEILDGREAKMVMGGQGSLLKRALYLVKMAKVGMRLSKDIMAIQHKVQLDEKARSGFISSQMQF